MEILAVILLNALGLIWCYPLQSDKLTDLIYSVSFFLITALLWYNKADNIVHHLMLIMISFWAIRLGFYLFVRIHAMGKDSRFDQVRKEFALIAGFWGLQTISILILALPIIFLFEHQQIALHWLHYAGVSVWLVGWIIETVADIQKFRFRQDEANEGKFIQSGLWAVVQHPNYTGEIMCWIGVFLVTLPSLVGWQWISIVSPLWITILLTKISGIPFLHRASKKKYGHLESFRKYQAQTKLLIPMVY